MFHPGELPGHTFCRFFMFEKLLFGPLLLFSGAFGLEGALSCWLIKAPCVFQRTSSPVRLFFTYPAGHPSI